MRLASEEIESESKEMSGKDDAMACDANENCLATYEMRLASKEMESESNEMTCEGNEMACESTENRLVSNEA